MDNTLENLIYRSISQYHDILAHFAEISRALQRNAADEISAQASILAKLQKDAEDCDRELDEILSKAPPPVEAIGARLMERRNLMKKVYETNRLLFRKADGMMAVIRNDISQVRAGRNALGGYLNHTEKKGGMVRGVG